MTSIGLAVDVDGGMCAASGYCTRIAPSLFRLEINGVAVTRIPVVTTEVERALATEAAEVCPTGAIVLRERDVPI
jgi:ferredoxin